MDSTENKPGAPAPEPEKPAETPAASPTGEAQVSHEATSDATGSYTYYDDYGYEQHLDSPAVVEQTNVPAVVEPPSPPAPPPPPPPPKPEPEEEDADEEGMLRMSFLEHLEELRVRIIRCLIGVGVAFFASLYFMDNLWKIVTAPADAAMNAIGLKNHKLVVTSPTEAFSIIWVKLPILTALFLASPWILYQVWRFIAPGLYKRERHWATPFVVCTAGLFILGGVFAYFVAFRLGLAFLLGIAVGNNLEAMVTITEYFDLFVNVSLGMAIVFELPVLIFFLSLLRILSARFLIGHSRYAILIITILAALITPTPDAINLMIITVPMTALYFLGVFAAYLLELSREGQRFPWRLVLLVLLGLAAVTAGGVYLVITKYGFHLVRNWPFLVR